MATTRDSYIALSPGAIGALPHRMLHYPDADIYGARMAANLIAKAVNKTCGPIVGCGYPYAAGEWTVTATGTSAAAATNGSGALLTAGSDSTFNTTLQSLRTFSITEGYWLSFFAQVKVSDITAVGFDMGVGTVQVDPHTTNYTDGIYFRKAATTAPVIGRVRGNSGTVADSGTLATSVNDTFISMGFACRLSATGPAGFFDVGGTRTNFTADQLAQVVAMFTSPQLMYMTLAAKGSAGNPTVIVNAALCEEDNGVDL